MHRGVCSHFGPGADVSLECNVFVWGWEGHLRGMHRPKDTLTRTCARLQAYAHTQSISQTHIQHTQIQKLHSYLKHANTYTNACTDTKLCTHTRAGLHINAQSLRIAKRNREKDKILWTEANSEINQKHVFPHSTFSRILWS